MVSKSIILERLESLEKSLELAKKLGKNSSAKFVETVEIHMLAERCLHLAMEAVLDIANHLVSEYALGRPQTYADSIEKLAEAKIITRKLGERLIPWVGFRNLLVHGYLKLDHLKSYQAIQKDLKTLEAFKKVVEKLL